MNTPSLLAVALIATTAFSATAVAQAYGSYPGADPVRTAPADDAGEYDYARVIRVDPIIGTGSTQPERCYENSTGPAYTGDDRDYRNDDYYGEGDYRRDDGYARGGSETGRTLSTVLGSLAGAVLGSKIGDGSGSMIGTVVGGTVGGIAGRSVYENSQRRTRQGSVRYCDPVPVRNGSDAYGHEDERVVGYDVTYEYAGRVRHTRTDHHPGDRIRVRVMAE